MIRGMALTISWPARRLVTVLGLWGCLVSPVLMGQEMESSYVWPREEKVLENLKRWQGFKFGILVHQGLYSQLGIVESWELCPEDWVTRPGFDDYYAFAQDYRGTKSVFNPVRFEPKKWVTAFKKAGAKYVIYTAKHHDGFCLFDTHCTEFRVSDKGCPFSTNARSNLVREVFNACRGEGLAVGAYFSKPDWSSPYFWWPYYPPKDRNPSYDITKHPERWKQFIDYTHRQVNELTSDYGPLDILWLDGCWVRPLGTINSQVAEFCKYPYDMDIDVKSMALSARQKQPGLLVVDRWVPGEFENYLTPEQKIPDKPLHVPWESCITMGGAWGWVPHDHYKDQRELVQMLVKVVAKGGNLLLGIGPNGQGEFEREVYARLEEMGNWLKVNGDAIYGTMPIEPCQQGQICYTQKGKTVFAIYLPNKGERELPREIVVKAAIQGKVKASLLGENRELESEPRAEGLKVVVPDALREQLAREPAVVVRVVGDQL
jgi:alpha-L-fucosidase